jgi:DNA-binding transcriptional ArsR family regulator
MSGRTTQLAAEPAPDDGLDGIFRALASAHRRRMLDLLREGPRTTTELTRAFPALSRFAVMQHLRVLEEANLVVTQKAGRVRTNHLNVVPIQEIHERWVSRYEAHWTSALVALKRELEKPPH